MKRVGLLYHFWLAETMIYVSPSIAPVISLGVVRDNNIFTSAVAALNAHITFM